MAKVSEQPPVLPYATPAPFDHDGVWREGNLVVKRLGAALPPRCVACNAAANHWLRMNFRFYPAMKLVMTGVYRNIAVPMCAKHLQTARRRWWVGVLMRLLGLGLIALNFALTANEIITGLASFSLLLAATCLLIGGEWISQSRTGLRMTNATRHALYFRGAGGSFLSSLPRSTGVDG